MPARHRHGALRLGLGQGGEILGTQRADVERRGAAAQLHVLLGGTQLELHLPGRQRAHHVEEQAGGQHDRARARHRTVEWHAQADLEVGGTQLDGGVSRVELDTGERLYGAVG